MYSETRIFDGYHHDNLTSLQPYLHGIRKQWTGEKAGMHAHSVGCGSLSWRKGGTVDGVYLWLQYQDPCLGGLLLAIGTKLRASCVQKNMKQKKQRTKGASVKTNAHRKAN